MKWYGDIETPAKFWAGLTRWLDTEWGQADGDVREVLCLAGNMADKAKRIL